MTTSVEIPIINAPFQRLTTVINGKAVGITLSYNASTNRWSFGLEKNGVVLLSGRRLVPGVDLLKPFGFGLGKMVLLRTLASAQEPGRSEVPAGAYRLFFAW